MLRLAAIQGGRVTIDDRDVRTIPLQHLRSVVTFRLSCLTPYSEINSRVGARVYCRASVLRRLVRFSVNPPAKFPLCSYRETYQLAACVPSSFKLVRQAIFRLQVGVVPQQPLVFEGATRRLPSLS